MSEQKIITLIGFAVRAGKAALGRSAVISAYKKRQLQLLVVANDAGGKITSMLPEFDVPVYHLSNREVLGKTVGRDELAILGITDSTFAKSFRKAFAED